MLKLSALGSALACTLALVLSSPAAEPEVIKLWPGKAPGEKGDIGEEKSETGKDKITRISNVSTPTLTIHRPAKDKDTGAAIVICPGGGYTILAWDHEGEQVASWLNSLGITGIILKYRVPRRPDQPKDQPPIGALQDAQRALSMVRSKAKDWNFDPKRIGLLGFSAGGHLTAWASTNYDKRAYEPMDEIDKVSCRPDFAVLVYPGGVVPKDKDELSPEIKVTKETPPCFFAHAGNDPVRPENSIVMYLALKKLNVPAELHIYGSGGHGFGMRKTEHPSSTWPQRCEEWMRDQKILKSGTGS